LRQSTHDTSVLKSANGTVLGISLGWDFCGEHLGDFDAFSDLLGLGKAELSEDAKRMLNDAGVDDAKVPVLGIEARMATTVPKGHTHLYKWTNDTKTLVPETRFVFSNREDLGNRRSKSLQLPIRLAKDGRHNGAEMIASWADGEFVVRAFSEEAMNAVEAVYDAMLHCDLTFGRGSNSNSFGGGGPTLLIASRIPESTRKQVLMDDVAVMILNSEAMKSGREAAFETGGSL